MVFLLKRGIVSFQGEKTARPWSRDFLTFAVREKCRKTSILRSLKIVLLSVTKQFPLFKQRSRLNPIYIQDLETRMGVQLGL